MNATTAIRRQVSALNRAVSGRYPEPPIALVSGPQVALSTGDPDRLFWIASVDKVFTATLVGQLADAGLLAPTTPIGELLPSAEVELLPAANGITPASDITVQHLLSHTAGLPDVLLPPRGYDSECSIRALQENPSRAWTTPQMLRQAEHLPAAARPGERFHYGDTAYLLLMRIIEEATGQRYVERLRQNIFERCVMQISDEWAASTAKQRQDRSAQIARFWPGGSRRDLRHDLALNFDWGSAIGGISTANDLVRFQQALHSEELCSQSWLELMSAPRNRMRPGIHYGAGTVTMRFGGFSPLLRKYPEPVGGLGYTATHMFFYPQQRTHVILNFHAHARMTASVRAHIRLASLITKYG